MARYYRRRKFCRFTAEGTKEIDYKDLAVLKQLSSCSVIAISNTHLPENIK